MFYLLYYFHSNPYKPTFAPVFSPLNSLPSNRDSYGSGKPAGLHANCLHRRTKNFLPAGSPRVPAPQTLHIVKTPPGLWALPELSLHQLVTADAPAFSGDAGS